MNRIQCTVHGKVQGVGFRYWTQKKALALGLCGWVKNLPDGSVALEAQGAENALTDFMDALHHGPLFSKVTQIECSWKDALPEPEQTFLITY